MRNKRERHTENMFLSLFSSPLLSFLLFSHSPFHTVSLSLPSPLSPSLSLSLSLSLYPSLSLSLSLSPTSHSLTLSASLWAAAAAALSRSFGSVAAVAVVAAALDANDSSMRGGDQQRWWPSAGTRQTENRGAEEPSPAPRLLIGNLNHGVSCHSDRRRTQELGD